MAVGPDQVGQHLGVPRIRLGTRDGMAVAVAADGQRIDRIDLGAGRHQRAHEQATIGLGPHHHLGRILSMGGEQLLQRRQPGQPSATRRAARTRPLSVMTATSWCSSAPSSPTNSTHPPLLDQPAGRARGSPRHPNGPVLDQRHATPPVVSFLSDQRGHDLELGFNHRPRRLQCFPAGGSSRQPLIPTR
jgi:hypothetical protein